MWFYLFCVRAVCGYFKSQYIALSTAHISNGAKESIRHEWIKKELFTILLTAQIYLFP